MDLQVGVENKWTNDSQHLLLEYFDIFQHSPSHIYHSALPMLPSSSWLYNCYGEPTVMVKAVKGLLSGWGKCSRTILLDSYTRTLSYYNNTIAIGSECGDIIILNAIIGSQIAVFSGHTAEVNSVVFSSDGALLVSGSDDWTVKLWDVQTGGVIRTFSGHTYWISSVSLSADCTTIASRSDDGILCLWNAKTGNCYYTITCGSGVQPISFSAIDPQHPITIISGEVLQWDMNGHQVKLPYPGSYIAFSPDGTLLVIYHKGTVTVQNSNSGAIVARFQPPSNDTTHCCFSPDNKFVAVAANTVISVWDISSDPHLVETFTGHADEISALVFSSPSSLISVSFDKLVKFWQIDISSVEPDVINLESVPAALPLVSSISLKARVGVAISSDVAEEMKIWDIPTSDCKAPSQALAKYYRHGHTKLINNRLIFVWYMDEEVSIWDAGEEEFLLQLNAPKDTIVDLRISGDGSMLFCIHHGFIQVRNVWTGVIVDKVWYEDLDGVELLAMDSSRVWVRYYDTLDFMPSRGWDLGPSGFSPIKRSTKPPQELHFGSSKLWDSSQCRISDTVTGKVVFQLPARCGTPVDIKWNGQYLVASFQSRMELVLEFHPAFFQ